jgi:hypothetical protein
MKASIQVTDRREGDAIRAGLENDPVLRAIVVITGLLAKLPSDRARARVMEYVRDRLDEEDADQMEVTQASNGGP